MLHTDSSAKADGLVPRRRCDSGVIAETGEADKGEAFQVLDCTLSLVLGGIDVEVDLAPTYMIAYKHCQTLTREHEKMVELTRY